MRAANPGSLGPPADPDRERLTRLLRASSAVAAAFSGALALTRFLLDGLVTPVGWTLATAMLVFAALPVLAARGLDPRRAGFWMAFAAGTSLFAMAGFESGLRSEAFHWVAFVPLVAALFLGARGALGFGVGCALVTGVFALAHRAGQHFGAPPIPAQHVFIHFAAAATAPLFGALLGMGYERTRRAAERSVAASRQRLAELIEALPDAIVRLSTGGIVQDLVLPRDHAGDMRSADFVGRSLRALLPGAPGDAALAQVRETLAEGRLTFGEYELALGPRRRLLELRAVPGADDGVVGVLRDVTRARRLEQLREQFVATVSHELRTPLTSIHGSLGLVAGGVFGELPKDVAELIEVASANSERLRRLIDDLLDIRELESGELALRIEPVELGDALRLACIANEAMATTQGVTLELDEPFPAVCAAVDPERLQQVLTNLISNAIKHSPAGASVTVALETGVECARIQVSDRGQGIPEAFRARVFERFTQADPSTTRAVGGTGLGLAIARELVERMGGSIEFESEEGRGTTFAVELPRRADPESG